MHKTDPQHMELPRAPGIVFIVKAIGISYGLTLAFFLVLSALVAFLPFPESIVPISVFIVTVLSVLLTGILVARATKSKGWLYGAISGLLYIFTLYLIGALAFQSSSSGVSILTMLAVGALSGALGGMIGVNFKR